LECQHCGQLLYFENARCERCKHVLGYLPDRAALCALAPLDGQRWRPLIAPPSSSSVSAPTPPMAPATGWCRRPDTFCKACRLNRTVPDLAPPDHLLCWQRLEPPSTGWTDPVHTSAAFEYQLLFRGSM
jgi:hypothetical protein